MRALLGGGAGRKREQRGGYHIRWPALCAKPADCGLNFIDTGFEGCGILEAEARAYYVVNIFFQSVLPALLVNRPRAAGGRELKSCKQFSRDDLWTEVLDIRRRLLCC